MERCKACQDRLDVAKLLLAVYGDKSDEWDKERESLKSEILHLEKCDPGHSFENRTYHHMPFLRMV